MDDKINSGMPDSTQDFSQFKSGKEQPEGAKDKHDKDTGIETGTEKPSNKAAFSEASLQLVEIKTKEVDATAVSDITTSTIEKSTAEPTSQVKGYAAGVNQPQLPKPGVHVDPTTAFKVVGDFPVLHAAISTQMASLHGGPIFPKKEFKNDEELASELTRKGVSGKHGVQIIRQVVETTLTPDVVKTIAKALLPLQSSAEEPNPQVKATLESVLKQVLQKLEIEPPLTPEQISNYISLYLSDPESPHLPEDIKGVLNAIMPTVTAIVDKHYDEILPSTQEAQESEAAKMQRDAKNMVEAGVANLKEKLANSEKAANEVLKNPEKSLYLNYLKAIGQAIDKLTQVLFEIEVATSEAQKKESAKKLDMQLSALHKLAEAEWAAQHPPEPSKLDKFLHGFEKALLVAVAALLAPVTCGASLAVAIIYCVKPQMLGKVAQEIDSACKKLADVCCNIFHGDKDKWEKAFAFVSLAVATMAEWAISCGNPLLFLALWTQKDGPVDAALATWGMSPQNRAIFEAVLNAVIQIIMAVIMIALTPATGGASDVGAAAELSSVAATGTEAGATIAEGATTAAKVAETATAVTSTISEAGIEMTNMGTTAAKVAENAAEGVSTGTKLAHTTASAATTATEVATASTDATTAAAEAIDEFTGAAEAAKNAETAGNIVKEGMTTQRKIQIFMLCFQGTMDGLQSYNSYVNMQNDFLNADLVVKKAHAEAYYAEVQAIIAVIQKCIDVLLAALAANPDFIMTLSNFQSAKYTDAGKIGTELFS